MNKSDHIIARGQLFFSGADEGNGELVGAVRSWANQFGGHDGFKSRLPLDLRAVDYQTSRMSTKEELWYSQAENQFWSISYDAQRSEWIISRLISQTLSGARTELRDIRWNDIKMWEQEDLLAAI